MYKEVSEISDLTEESYPDGVQMLKDGAKDLENYDKLMEQTKKKLRILDGKNTILTKYGVQMMAHRQLAQSQRTLMNSLEISLSSSA